MAKFEIYEADKISKDLISELGGCGDIYVNLESYWAIVSVSAVLGIVSEDGDDYSEEIKREAGDLLQNIGGADYIKFKNPYDKTARSAVAESADLAQIFD